MKKPTHNSLGFIPTGICLFACILASPTKAANYYWDINGTAAGSGGVAPSGLWEGANWATVSGGTAATGNWMEDNFPRFAAATDTTSPYTVTANANHTVVGMLHGNVAGTVTITGTGVFTIDPTGGAGPGLNQQGFFGGTGTGIGFLKIQSKLTGTGGVQSQSGQIFLDNAGNDYTGGTTINSGLINFNSTGSFGTGLITVGTGGSALIAEADGITITNDFSAGVTGGLNLSTTGHPFTTTYSGNWNLGQFTLSLGVGGGADNTANLTGTISGTGGLSKQSQTTAGTLKLSGANTYGGPSTISSGTLQIGNGAALGYSATTVASGAVIDLNGVANINAALLLNGTGISSAGALVNSNLSSSAVLIQGDSVAGATLTAAGSGITAPATVTVTGGGGSGATAAADLGVTAASFTITAGTQKYTAVPTVTISGGGGFGATATCALAGASPSVISTTITVTGAGDWFTGTPTITFSGGTIGTAGTAPTGTGNATHFTLRSVSITAPGSGYTSAPTLTLSSGTGTAAAKLSSVNLASATSAGGPGDTTINTIISGAAAATFTKVGAGTMTLNAVNTYSGNTIVSSGTLVLGSSGTINSTPIINIAAGATFDVSAISSYTLSSSTTLQAISTTVPATIKGGTSVSLASRPVALAIVPTAFTGDTAHPALVISQGSLTLNNNVITVTNSAATPLNVGTYRLIQVGDGTTGVISGTPNSVPTIQGTGLAAGTSGSIVVSGGNVNLIVQTAPTFSGLTVNQSIVYGTTPLTLSGTLSATGPVYPDIGETVTVTINGNAQTTTINDATGDFSINYNPATIPFSATAYAVTYSYAGNATLGRSSDATKTLTVTKAPLTVTANDQTKTYGQTLSVGTGKTLFTSSGLLNGQTIGTVTLASTGSAATSAAGGSYTITPSAATGGTFSANNYSITYAAGTLTVNPAPLTVTANNLSRPYGATNPIFTVAYTGFANGQNLGTSDVAGAPVLGTDADTNSPVGAYVITNNLGTLTSTNYALALVDGIVTVTNAASTNVVSVSANPVATGSAVTLTATLSAVSPSLAVPDGAVQFVLDGTPFGDPVTLTNGVANTNTAVIAHGTHTLVAEYSGSTNVLGSTNSLSSSLVVNIAPSAGDDAIQRPDGAGTKVSIATLLSNDTDADSDALVVTGISTNSTQGGTISMTATEVFYTPPGTNVTSDTFTYTVGDGFGGSATATVTVTIAPPDNTQPSNITGINTTGDGNMQINFAGIPGRNYLIQAATNLTPSINWTTIGTNTAGTNGLFFYIDLDSTNFAARYYRTAQP
ncbi:beta strand repeat-containing protein [Pedosphaera parvula]|uniref:Autotransporter-associated beta strand repeat protein n=1 Tax=Pedosphaera parvula (strain Ellin514) TaxID=320771 RepID=B9XM01_PEDPL|nr:MBG domain-containing protein [Pedosphaera parvula]EEF59129.1 autotransporter-associated beta strand repeat protein [Pedosphaera parvula Ellin514]